MRPAGFWKKFLFLSRNHRDKRAIDERGEAALWLLYKGNEEA